MDVDLDRVEVRERDEGEGNDPGEDLRATPEKLALRYAKSVEFVHGPRQRLADLVAVAFRKLLAEVGLRELLGELPVRQPLEPALRYVEVPVGRPPPAAAATESGASRHIRCELARVLRASTGARQRLPLRLRPRAVLDVDDDRVMQRAQHLAKAGLPQREELVQCLDGSGNDGRKNRHQTGKRQKCKQPVHSFPPSPPGHMDPTAAVDRLARPTPLS